MMHTDMLTNSYFDFLTGATILLVNAEHPNVVSIFLNKKHKLHTTHSWDFLGLERHGEFPEASLWRRSSGEDIIIGNLDTGNDG